MNNMQVGSKQGKSVLIEHQMEKKKGGEAGGETESGQKAGLRHGQKWEIIQETSAGEENMKHKQPGREGV